MWWGNPSAIKGGRLINLGALLKSGGAGEEVNNGMYASDGSTRSRCLQRLLGIRRASYGPRPSRGLKDKGIYLKV